MVVKHNHRFVENVEQVGGIIFLLCLIFHIDVLEVANGIETGVAEKAADLGIVAGNLDAVYESVNSFSGTIVCGQRALKACPIGKADGGNTVADSYAGNGMNADETSRVAGIMIVRALHQGALWIKVAQSHIYSYGGIEVCENRSTVSLISECVHVVQNLCS